MDFMVISQTKQIEVSLQNCLELRQYKKNPFSPKTFKFQKCRDFSVAVRVIKKSGNFKIEIFLDWMEFFLQCLSSSEKLSNVDSRMHIPTLKINLKSSIFPFETEFMFIVFFSVARCLYRSCQKFIFKVLHANIATEYFDIKLLKKCLE